MRVKPWLTQERFVSGGVAAAALTGGLLLGIPIGFNHHTPEQADVLLAFHQQASEEVGGDQLGRAGEEGLGERVGLGHLQAGRSQLTDPALRAKAADARISPAAQPRRCTPKDSPSQRS